MALEEVDSRWEKTAAGITETCYEKLRLRRTFLREHLRSCQTDLVRFDYTVVYLLLLTASDFC